MGAGDELRVLQLGAVETVDAEEAGEVQRAGERVDLRLADLQLADEEVQDLAVHALLDLQADGRAEAAPHQLLLEGLEEVLRVVLLHLQVLVAGEAEGVVLQDLHAGEQLFQMGGDDVLDGDVAARGRLQEAGEQRRDLDAGEVAVARDGVADDDREVEGEARDVREGVGRVDGEGVRTGKIWCRKRVNRRACSFSASSLQRTRWMPSSARPGATSSWKQAAWRAMSSRERAQIMSRTSRGWRPEAERVATPVAMRRLRPATRTMKNSSRLLAKIARKLARSRRGWRGPRRVRGRVR